MKKLMTLFVVVVFLSGCATRGPNDGTWVKNGPLRTVAKTTAAIALGTYAYQKTGKIGWGLVGAGLGDAAAEAAMWKYQEAPSVRYVNGGQYANASQQGCNGRSYCVQTVREVDPSVTREQQVKAFKNAPRFTIDNYMNVDGDGESPIPPSCQTPNLALASICVRAWADDLSKKQKQCIKEEKARISPRRPQCNDTLAADAYDAKVLADQLDARQEVVQGGKIVYK